MCLQNTLKVQFQNRTARAYKIAIHSFIPVLVAKAITSKATLTTPVQQKGVLFLFWVQGGSMTLPEKY